MRPYRVLLWCCALTAVLASGRPAQAGWNNVFQVCCQHCGGQQPSIAMASPAGDCDPCPQPCPQQVCTTRYIQRSYYQPVTTYRTSYYMEPVTTYRTSYYYEPVTTYRYSCHYDPCTCSYQQVAQPCTSYRLRSQCCPVTSYLQRCSLQPCTSYQQMTYYEPQTTCCTTTTGAPVAAVPAQPGIAVQPVQPVQPLVPGTAPSVGEGRTLVPSTGAPNVNDKLTPEPPLNPGMKFQRNPDLNKVIDNPYRQPQFGTPVPVSPAPKTNAQLDRVASLSSKALQGQVVSADHVGQANARVLFISADPQRVQRNATADTAGRFNVTLASGSWLVYVYNGQGKPVFNQRMEVGATDSQLVKLVNR